MANPRMGVEGQCFVCDPARRCLAYRDREEHHVIPEHLGGQQGPLVTLCASEHKAVHDLAEYLIRNRNIPPAPDSIQGKEWLRRVSLSNHILRAHDTVIKDPNRRVKFEARIPAKLHALIPGLKSHLGVKSNDELLAKILQMFSAKRK